MTAASLRSLFCLLISGIAADVAVSSVYMWSPFGYLTGSQCAQLEGGDIVTSEELAAELSRFNSPPDDAKPRNHHLVVQTSDRPEALLAFVYQKASLLNTDTSALRLIEEYLDSSKSCASVPFVDVRSTMSESLQSATRGDPRAQVLSLQLEQSNCGAILAQLQDSHLFGNGVTDLVQLRTDHKLDGECVRNLTALAIAMSKGRLVLAVTAEATKIITDIPCEMLLPHSRVLLQTIPGLPTAPGALQYISTPILMGLMLAFVLLLFLFIGITCLLSIDAPQRFATESLPVPKEY